MSQFNLPDVGEGLTEAEIITWMVKPGDTVAVNDTLVEIETAKSLVELPSPFAGTVTSLLVAEGETVAVGTPIIEIASDSADTTPEPQTPQQEAAGSTEDDSPPNLVGYGPRASSAQSSAQRRPRKQTAAPSGTSAATAQSDLHTAFSTVDPETSAADRPGAPAAEEASPAAESAAPSVGDAGGNGTAPMPTAASTRVLAKPPVRKLAKDLGVDLTVVTATGEGGVVTRGDVQAHAQAGTEKAAPGSVAVDRSATCDETRVPIKGVRKMTAEAMVSSAFTAPHVTEWVTVDVTRTMELVERLKADRTFADVRVSPLLVLAKAVCLALRRTPEVNSAWDEDTQQIVYKHYVNLGIATATPRGLVVPNIPGADSMSLHQIAVALGELVETAREGRTQPAEMSGGTFTITNVGVFGVDGGTPILNPGEAGILAFGAVNKRPWVVPGPDGDQVVPRSVSTLAVSFDHRLVDGEQGSRFLADVARLLEDPATALLY